MYTAIDIANLIIHKYGKEYNNKLSLLRLQTLLYFIQSEYIKRYGSPLIEEKLYKRRHGSVINSVYEAFKGWGYSHINKPTYQFELTDKGFRTREFDISIYNDRIVLLVESILNITNDINNRVLVEFIRSEYFWEKDKDIFLDVRNNVYYTFDELKVVKILIKYRSNLMKFDNINKDISYPVMKESYKDKFSQYIDDRIEKKIKEIESMMLSKLESGELLEEFTQSMMDTSGYPKNEMIDLMYGEGAYNTFKTIEIIKQMKK